jgi:Ca2+-binding RTX toxin-like protein
VNSDVLTVTGGGYSETIALRLTAGNSNVVEVDFAADGAVEYAFTRDTFSQIVVNGGGGDDVIVIDQANGGFTDTEITTLNGGDGNDTLTGGVGGEHLDGGPGDDTLDGNQGVDTLVGGAGNDVLRWDPGDGNDDLDGGADNDRLAFNGSNIGEVFTVAPVGGEARLTRNVATIAIDLDGVETLDLHALGGADVLQVSDVTGTDLTNIDADVAAFGGGDDAAVDEILVPPATTIGQDGGAVAVDGLGARVRFLGPGSSDRVHVTGTEAIEQVAVQGTASADTVSVTANGTDVSVFGPTPGVHVLLSSIDRLDVDLGAGDDSFSAIGNLAALVQLDVDGGAGADTILGGNGADVLTGGDDADLVDGNQGVDAVAGGNGTDVIQWDPGDGNDTVDGGAGTDRMQFNGSATNEIFGFNAVSGGHVQFTRNVASILLDLDNIETFDLNALAGVDQVLPGTVAGTDLTTINANFAAFGGVDDGQVDEVVVPPGLTIGNDGTAATVDGLGARIRVLGGALSDRVHVMGTISSDVQQFVGSGAADSFNATASGTDVAVVGATPGVHVLLTSVELLDVDLGGGNDTFSATGNLAALVVLDVDGGAGADTLLGGNGADILSGGADADLLDGNQGNDLVIGGGADDVVQWDPGDGNDTIDGGLGTDRLVFHGSATNEVFGVSANGDHVRLIRNVANIVLDIDGIEALDLNALAGTDVVQIDNLAGTDLTSVTANLNTFNAAADGVADQVIVNGTAGDDTVAVVATGSAVAANGLAASVRVMGADPTLDRLTVNGLAGTDTITGTPEAAALLLLELLP